MGPTKILFPSQANTVSAEKLNARTVIDIYITFGHWGVQAALDISNIKPLKVKQAIEISYWT